MAGFIALTTLCAAILRDQHGRLMSFAVGACGLIVSWALWVSLERSFDFRDHFANLMRAQENWLGVAPLGALSTGEAKHGVPRWRFGAQRSTFRLLLAVFAIGFLLVGVHGFSDAGPSPACASSAPSQTDAGS